MRMSTPRTKIALRAAVGTAVSILTALAGTAMAQGAGILELKVGDEAPAFRLMGSDGNEYSLKQFKGKQSVVLAFFPKAFTPGWTAQCKSLRDSGDDLKKYKVAYFMISIDSAEDNKRFAETHGGNFPILSDPSKEVAKAYGALNKSGFFANRWSFYIDKEGIIRKIDKKVKPLTAGADTAKFIDELGLATKASD